MFLSFISSSNPGAPRTLRRLLLTAGAAFAILVAAESIARLVSPRIGPALSNLDSQLDNKRTLAWQLARGGTRAQVLVLGNSTAYVGVVPEIVRKELPEGMTVFNGALAGYDYSIHKAFTEQFYLPLLSPKILVLCTTMMDFNLNESGFAENSRILEKSVPWSLLMDASTYSPQVLLYRWSALFRYSLNVQQWLRLSLGTARLYGTEDPFGFTPCDGNASPDERIRPLVIQHLQNFEIGGFSRSSLFQMVGDFRKNGFEILLVNMPVSPKLSRLLPTFETDYRRYAEDLYRKCEEYEIQLLDLNRVLSLQESDFADEYHANSSGRERISQAIGQRLNQQFMAQSLDLSNISSKPASRPISHPFN
jgi:hypothetical protein